jgi:6-phosphogluconolactonase
VEQSIIPAPIIPAPIPRPDAVLPGTQHGGQQCRWHAQADSHALQKAAAEWIVAAATAAVAARGQFHLVLAGGETPRGVYQRLRRLQTDWSVWHIYFGDERCLPPGDAARNSRMAGEAWLDHVTIPAAQIHIIPAELGARRAADVYAESLRALGDFDLVLLGLGDDGHTASLFPAHDWGTEPGAPDTLAVCDAPKPPPARVSLSAARLGRARQVLFLISGENKRTALADWRSGKAIPAGSIRPAAGVDVLLELSLWPPAGEK